MSWIDDYLLPTLRLREFQLVEELNRIRAARAELGDIETRELPSGRVVSLYSVAREVTDEVIGPGAYAEANCGNPHPAVREQVRVSAGIAPAAVREAAADDVGALVNFMGYNRAVPIAQFLGVKTQTVLRRLFELRREELVEQTRHHWMPTPKGQALNAWEFRARELSRRAG